MKVEKDEQYKIGVRVVRNIIITFTILTAIALYNKYKYLL